MHAAGQRLNAAQLMLKELVGQYRFWPRIAMRALELWRATAGNSGTCQWSGARQKGGKLTFARFEF